MIAHTLFTPRKRPSFSRSRGQHVRSHMVYSTSEAARDSSGAKGSVTTPYYHATKVFSTDPAPPAGHACSAVAAARLRCMIEAVKGMPCARDRRGQHLDRPVAAPSGPLPYNSSGASSTATIAGSTSALRSASFPSNKTTSDWNRHDLEMMRWSSAGIASRTHGQTDTIVDAYGALRSAGNRSDASAIQRRSGNPEEARAAERRARVLEKQAGPICVTRVATRCERTCSEHCG